MTDFPRLEAMIPEVQEAKAEFKEHVERIDRMEYHPNGVRVAMSMRTAALARFNSVLERAYEVLAEECAAADKPVPAREDMAPEGQRGIWFRARCPLQYLRDVVLTGETSVAYHEQLHEAARHVEEDKLDAAAEFRP